MTLKSNYLEICNIEKLLTREKPPIDVFIQPENNILNRNESDIDFSIELKSYFVYLNEYYDGTGFKHYVSESETWIGYIISKNEVSFEAKLFNSLVNDTFEVADFEIKDVSKDDLQFLEIGSVFYWSIGRESNNGQISKKSFLRFKREVPLESEEFDKLSDSVRETMDKIKWI